MKKTAKVMGTTVPVSKKQIIFWIFHHIWGGGGGYPQEDLRFVLSCTATVWSQSLIPELVEIASTGASSTKERS